MISMLWSVTLEALSVTVSVLYYSLLPLPSQLLHVLGLGPKVKGQLFLSVAEAQ